MSRHSATINPADIADEIRQANHRQTALEDIARKAITWQMGLTSGTDLLDTIARHRETLAYLDPVIADPGLRLAFPEALDEREPEAGFDFLPVSGAVRSAA